jgi:hypothetical protein
MTAAERAAENEALEAACEAWLADHPGRTYADYAQWFDDNSEILANELAKWRKVKARDWIDRTDDEKARDWADGVFIRERLQALDKIIKQA